MMSFALIGHAADRAAKPNGKAAAPALDFLEYLGTLEGDEENWTDVVKIELSEMATSAATNVAKPISSSDIGAGGKSKKVEPNATKSESKAESAAQSGK